MLKNFVFVVSAFVLVVLLPQPVDAEPPALRSLLVVPHADSLTTYGANRVDLVIEYDGTDADLAGGLAKITVKEKRGKKTSWSILLTAESIDTESQTVRLTTDLDLDDTNAVRVTAQLINRQGEASRRRRQRLAVSEDPESLAIIDQVENGLLPEGAASPVSIDVRMQELGVPAASVAVFDDFRIQWLKAYGLRRQGTAREANTGTLFQAASISKPVSVLAALILHEKGALALDEDVNGVLHSWQVPENEFTANEKVTLRRLITHTAGFTLHGFRGYRGGEAIPTLLQILDGFPPANSEPIRVNFVPGSQAVYSGGGITVLQQLMIDAVDTPFEEILESLVFQPLDMHRSTFAQPLPGPLQKNAAIAHSVNYPDLRGAIAFTYPELAAAGLWTTPADLARHMIGLIEAYHGLRSDLISRRLARRMLKNHMDGMGMGWFIEGNREELFFLHGGANIGFRAMAIARPSTGSGLVVMTNSTNGDQLSNEIAAAIAAQYD